MSTTTATATPVHKDESAMLALYIAIPVVILLCTAFIILICYKRHLACFKLVWEEKDIYNINTIHQPNVSQKHNVKTIETKMVVVSKADATTSSEPPDVSQKHNVKTIETKMVVVSKADATTSSEPPDVSQKHNV
eukprot:263732_1